MTGRNYFARFGRFIEIGKRVSLANMRPEDGAFHKLYDFRFRGLGPNHPRKARVGAKSIVGCYGSPAKRNGQTSFADN